MSYSVIRTDNMAGTDVRAKLVSVKYVADDAVTEIENGRVVKLDGLMEGQRETFKAVDVAANTPLHEVYIVASPEVMYDERKRSLDEFINETYKPARAYAMVHGQMFGLTADAFEGTPAKDAIVELAAGIKLKAVSSATSNSTTIGKIIAVEKAGMYTYYVVKVD